MGVTITGNAPLLGATSVLKVPVSIQIQVLLVGGGGGAYYGEANGGSVVSSTLLVVTGLTYVVSVGLGGPVIPSSDNHETSAGGGTASLIKLNTQILFTAPGAPEAVNTVGGFGANGAGSGHDGIFSSITGTSVEYAHGGDASFNNIVTTYGGGGAYYFCPGNNGVVILSIPTQFYGTAAGSFTSSISGSNTIITFTGAGSYTA
jgi:hypothetical protein